MVFDIFKWGSIVLGIGLILTIYAFFNILGNATTMLHMENIKMIIKIIRLYIG